MSEPQRPESREVSNGPTGNKNAIVVDSVSKSFGDTEVLHDIDLTVRHGEIFGLMGPSGCGKSTLMKLLVGQAVPSDGTVRVLDVAPGAFGTHERESIAYVPQSFVLYPSLTVEQNARFMAGVYGLGWMARRRRIREALTTLDLWEARKRLARNISGGMQRRLALACALLPEPTLLFVDEPTAGLDPLLRGRVWEHLHSLREEGVTTFVTTQHLEEAAHCDRVGFMREGRLIASGTPEHLREMAVGGQALDIVAPHIDGADTNALAELPGVRSVEPGGWGRLRVVVDDVGKATPVVSAALQERGVRVESIRPHEPSFDEVFLALVQEPEEALA